jgi:hypothetical protein
VISTIADGFADGGKVHLRTNLKMCTGKRQVARETLPFLLKVVFSPSAELAQNVRVPPAWRSLQPRVASNLVKATVYGVDSRHHRRHVLIRGVFIPLPHMLGTRSRNTARAFPRGPLHGYTL